MPEQDEPITGLGEANLPLTGNEAIVLVQNGVTKRTVLNNLPQPGGQLDSNELAAVQNANAPTGENPFATVADIPVLQTNTTFAPTITDEVQGTFLITNFIIDSVGDVVTFSFAGRFDLDALETSGSCKFNLPTAFQPTANWASQTDVNVAMSRTNDIFTVNTFIAADDSGTKLLQVNVNDVLAGSSVRFSAVGRYKIA
jgi:hypothetical protein